MLQGPAGKARQNQRFLGADVVENPNDFDLEFLYLIAGKDSSADPAQTGANLPQRKERSLRGNSSGQQEDRRDHKAGHLTIVPAVAKKIPASPLTAEAPYDTM
jgi:hypothetical protein